MAPQVRPALPDPENGIDPLEVTKMLRRKSSRFHQGQEPESAPLNRPDICMQSKTFGHRRTFPLQTRVGPYMPFVLPSMLPLLSSPLEDFFFPAFFRRCATSPRLVWRLPVALGPLVANDLLSGRTLTSVTRCSLRLSTRAGTPVGGDPIYPTASLHGPEVQRAASTSPKAEA
jgi:hypothetical protein